METEGSQPDYSGFRMIDVCDVGDVSVVRPRERKIIDDDYIQWMGQELFDLVEKCGRHKVVVDFGLTEFLSSAALGKAITLHKKVGMVKGRLLLCNIRPEIYEVFAITKLNRLFDIQDDEADALAALGA